MTATVFLAVLLAALLHACWNALIRADRSKVSLTLIMTLVQGCFGVAWAVTQPLPGGAVWGWLLASGAFHSGYKLFLAYAYEHGDLSRVYPIARGAAPMLVLAFSAVFLAEGLSTAEGAGILVLGLGILLMGRGAIVSGESRRLVPLALGSATMTAGYSLVDGMGARALGDAATYVAWLFIFDALFYSPVVLVARGRSAFVAPPRSWGLGAAAAVFSYGAYAIAVWAMTLAPIPLVTALRETSILFAVLIGWLAFRERMDWAKATAAALILAGVALTRL